MNECYCWHGVLLPRPPQVCPPPCTVYCLLQVWNVRKQQPFSRPGSPRAQQPQRSGVLLVRGCILWALKAGQKSPLRWPCQALAWFYSGSCHSSWHPWAAAPKALISTRDHIAWAGVQAAASAAGVGEGKVTALQPSPAICSYKKLPNKVFVMQSMSTSSVKRTGEKVQH